MKRRRRTPRRSFTRSRAESHKEERQAIKTIEPMTHNQEVYMDSIDDNLITFCVGVAGTGKSWVAAGMFSSMLHSGDYDQIVVTRPLVCAGKDIGALPGELGDKILPYLKPMEENLKYFLGQTYYGHYLNNRQIKYEPLELMRGMTYNRTLMLLDEAQNCTPEQIKMFMTRIGKDSKMVINGDIKQTDISKRSGLDVVLHKLEQKPIDGLGICYLTYEDIQRNGIISDILLALEE
jgi:phosphate starvation-inducible protein PhoH and related proteins